MKEFIDKLIGRLNAKLPMYASGWRKDMNNIINQLAEEYEECFKDCKQCEVYNREEHYCPKWCYVIKNTVKEMVENESALLLTQLLEAKRNCGEDSDCSGCIFGQIEDRCILAELQKDAKANNESVKGDLISRSVLLEEIKSLRVTVMGLRAGKGILAEYANQYKDTLLRVIEEQPIACNDEWIPCEKELPKYTGDYNVTVGVSNELGYYEDVKTFRFLNIKGEEPRWEIPQSSLDLYTVIAWQPLPPKFEPKGE